MRDFPPDCSICNARLFTCSDWLTYIYLFKSVRLLSAAQQFVDLYLLIQISSAPVCRAAICWPISTYSISSASVCRAAIGWPISTYSNQCGFSLPSLLKCTLKHKRVACCKKWHVTVAHWSVSGSPAAGRDTSLLQACTSRGRLSTLCSEFVDRRWSSQL